MNDITPTIFFLLLGFICGFIGWIFGYQLSVNPKLITQCEKALPRDQQCKLIAVPIAKAKGEE